MANGKSTFASKLDVVRTPYLNVVIKGGWYVTRSWPTDARFHERMAAECRAAGHEFGAKFHEERFKRFPAAKPK